VRIETSDGASVPTVCVFLTEGEARELRDSVDALLARRVESEPRADDHEHVSSPDYQTEITVAWEDA
jgi:hypothetical protein